MQLLPYNSGKWELHMAKDKGTQLFVNETQEINYICKYCDYDRWYRKLTISPSKTNLIYLKHVEAISQPSSLIISIHKFPGSLWLIYSQNGCQPATTDPITSFNILSWVKYGGSAHGLIKTLFIKMSVSFLGISERV